MYYFPQESHLDPTRIPHLYCLPKVSLLVSRNLLRFSNFPLPFISLSLKGNHINTPIYPFISQLQLATTSSHPPPGSSLLLLEAILPGGVSRKNPVGANFRMYGERVVVSDLNGDSDVWYCLAYTNIQLLQTIL